MTFSDDQRLAFGNDGFVRLEGAVPRAVVDEMRDRLWCQLASKGAHREDPSSWEPRLATGLQGIRRGDPDPRACPALRAALDAVFDGAEWTTKPHWGQALVTFPTSDPWLVPKTPWHLDHPFLQGPRISGANLFLFMDRVEARGGGTVVLRSSPPLIARFMQASGDLRGKKTRIIRQRLLGSHPFLEELSGKPMRPDRNERLMDRAIDVDGIATRVVELTGEPGDVVLAHPLLLHAIAQNASKRPRLMRASRVYRRDIYEKYLRGASLDG